MKKRKLLTQEEKIQRNKEACKKYYQKNKKSYLRRKKQWIQDNPEKHKTNKKNYIHKRRSQTSHLSGETLNKWVNDQPKICSYCNQDCAENYHIDHIEPLSKGGKHDLDNLTIACPSCNTSKSNKQLLFWLAAK